MIRLALTILALCTGGIAASEPIVRLDNPAAVAITLREEGFRAKLTETDNKRPRISTGIRGVRFSITFYGCREQIECEGLLFTAWFTLKNGVTPNQINDWNADALVGRAFVDDECNPALDHYVFADRSRSISHLAEEMELWGDTVTDFADFVFDLDNEAKRVVSCGGDDVL